MSENKRDDKGINNHPLERGGYLVRSHSKRGKIWAIPNSMLKYPSADEIRCEAADQHDPRAKIRMLVVADSIEQTVSEAAPNQLSANERWSLKRLANCWKITERALQSWRQLFDWGGIDALRHARESKSKMRAGIPPQAMTPTIAVFELCGSAINDIEREMRIHAQDATPELAKTLLHYADKLQDARTIEFGKLERYVLAHEERRLKLKKWRRANLR